MELVRIMKNLLLTMIAAVVLVRGELQSPKPPLALLAYEVTLDIPW